MRDLAVPCLAGIRELLIELGLPAPEIHPLTLIVDANVAIRDIARKSKNRDIAIPTNLEQSTDAGLVRVMSVPRLLEETNDEHLTAYIKNSRDSNLDLGRMRAARNLYVPDIPLIVPSTTARTPRVARVAEIDPKDVEYAALFEDLGPDALMTTDKVFGRAGFPTLGRREVDPMLLVRRFATELGVEWAGKTLIMGASYGVVVGTGGAWKALRALPQWAQVLFSVAVAGAFIHPGSRKTILDFVRPLLAPAAAVLLDVIIQSGQAKPLREQFEEEVERVLSDLLATARGRSLAPKAVLSIATNGGPMAPSDLALDLQIRGFGRRDPWEEQLQSALRAEPRLKILRDGRWELGHERVVVQRAEAKP